MRYERTIERGIELPKLCQRLQFEKDGVERPELRVMWFFPNQVPSIRRVPPRSAITVSH
jgi:hypothetical protein